MVAAAAAHGVSGLRVFGSVARGEDRPDSDVDLLADLLPGMSLFRLGRLQAELEAILGTRARGLLVLQCFREDLYPMRPWAGWYRGQPRQADAQ